MAGRVCTCLAEVGEDNSSNEEMENVSAAMAVEEVSTVPFVDNYLFTLLRKLEAQLETEARQSKLRSSMPSTEGDGNEDDTADLDRQSGQVESEARVSLDSLHVSQTYRMRAERSMKQGLADEAAVSFDEAYAEGVGYLPDR